MFMKVLSKDKKFSYTSSASTTHTRCSRRSVAQALAPGTARHGTKQGGTRRFGPLPPYFFLARPYPERALRDNHYGVPVTYIDIWAQCICFLPLAPV